MRSFGEYTEKKRNRYGYSGASFGEYTAKKKGSNFGVSKTTIPSSQSVSGPVKTSSKTTNLSVARDRINALDPKVRTMLENADEDSKKYGIYETEKKIMDATGWDIETFNSYYADMKIAKGEDVWFQKGATRDGDTKENKKKANKATWKDVQANASKAVMELAEGVVDWNALNGGEIAQTLAKFGMYQSNPAAYIGSLIGKEIRYLLNPKEKERAEEIKAQYNKVIEEFVEKDLINSEQIVEEKIIAPFETRTGLDVDEDSYLGSKTDELVQSASDMLAKQGLAYAAGTVSNFVVPGSGVIVTPLVGNYLTWASAGGKESANALVNYDATLEQARLSGNITGFGEMISEAMFDGFKFGGKTLSDGASKIISKYLGDRILGTIAKWGFNTVGEGVEEIVSGYISAVGKQLTYMSGKEINEIFTKEERWEAFFAAVVLGGIYEGGKVINAAVNPKANNYVTERSKTEQKVFNNLYEEAIKAKEAEKGGELTGKEKSKLYDDVEKAIKRGEIDIETIEKVLGGDTYKAYQEVVDSEKALREEYEKLGNVIQPTLAQMTRYNELHKQIEALKNSTTKSELKDKLGQEVRNMAKGTRLEESYNEKARKGQAFEADLSKYDEKQRAVIQKAVESGILNNTNKTHDFVNLIAKISTDKGISFDFTNNERLKASGFAIDGKIVNGFENGGNITLNINSAKALNSVVGHEVTHVLKGTDFYSDLQKAVFEYANMKGEYDTRLADITELYKGVKDADINEELIADLVGDYLFTDEKFVQQLFRQNRNAFQRVWNEIKNFCKIATAGSQEAKKLLEVQKIFEKVWNEGKVNTEENVSYSISESFYNQIDSWDGKTTGFSFVVGTTSDALMKAGIPNQQIRWDASKIKTTIEKHNGMSMEVIKQVPELLENPVVVIDSKQDTQSKIIMGELYDANGKIVTVVLKLNPTSKKGNQLDLIKISSSQGRGHIESLFKYENGESVKVRYVDEKRIQDWLNVNRLRLPLHSFNLDSNNIIPQDSENATANPKKSLSNNNQDIAPIGKWHVKGSDIGPVREDIGMSTSNLPDDYAPIAEEYLNKPTRMWHLSIENLAKQGKSGIMWLAEYGKLLRKGDVTAIDDDTNSSQDESGGDTSFTWKLRGKDVTLKDVKLQEICYVKRSSTELKTLRKEFNKTTRKTFLKDLGNNAEYLRNAGFPETDILKIQEGRVPDRWQVHHKLPLDDSGTNSFDNLVLILNEPYHKVITNYQNRIARKMKIGEVKAVQWPMPNGNIYPAQH